jgi:hypothetical protein
MKHAQEIFARADGEVEHASAGAPFVVEEGERIVQVGATEQYEIKFTESDGPSLPVVFKRHSCSELTYVHSVGKDMAMKKGRDQLVRTRRPLSRRRRDSWPSHNPAQVPDSVLLVVQSYPVSSLAHDQVMHRLRSAKWPVTLRFSRPLTDNDVTPLARCLQLEQQGELPDDLKLQMLKRLLSKGVAVKKHGSRKQAYDTVVYLNETMLFWRVRSPRFMKVPSLPYDSSPGMMAVGGFLCDFECIRTASGPVSRPSGEVRATAAERGRGRSDGAVALPASPGRRRGLPDASPVVPRLARRRRGRGRHPNAVAPCSGGRHAVDARRRQERMSWLVSFSNLRPFGPRRATAMLHAGERRPETTSK